MRMRWTFYIMMMVFTVVLLVLLLLLCLMLEDSKRKDHPEGRDANANLPGDHVKVEVNARKVRAKNGEATSFARRPCPSTSPTKERWVGIKTVFQEDIKPSVQDLGLAVSAFEVGGF